MKNKILLVSTVFALSGCGDNPSAIQTAVAEVAPVPTCEVSKESKTEAAPAAAAPAVESQSNKEEKAAKLMAAVCNDPKPSDVKKGVSVTLCNGSQMVGTYEETTVAAAPIAATATYQQCTSNGQVGCIANSSYAAYDATNLLASNIKSGSTVGGVLGTFSCPDFSYCSANNQTGCLATTSFPANNLNLANLTPSNIRQGITIGSVTGTLSTTAESHTDCNGSGQTGCIATASFPTATPVCSANGQKDCSIPSTGWKAIGEVSYGNIISSNIKQNVVIAGVTGTLQVPVAPSPFEVKKGVTINGVSGLIQTRCIDSDVAGAPAATKCTTTGWQAPTAEGVYYHVAMGMKVYPLGRQMSVTYNSTACSSLTVDGGGWRMPVKEEIQQAILYRMHKITELNPIDMNYVGGTIGYWVGTVGYTHSSIVDLNGGHVSGILNTVTTTHMGICVK